MELVLQDVLWINDFILVRGFRYCSRFIRMRKASTIDAGSNGLDRQSIDRYW
ncbi:hypothetical protein ACR30L_04080 [Psychromonas sp. PT13]|uniref:hypothetical protein n=1 Tax=Psychromonas sp. PT13 TaxID=3439547 RepID=UPI003EB9B50A